MDRWPVNTWHVISLDVWGNAEEGFEVNDRRECGTVEIESNDPGDGDIIDALVDAEYLKPGSLGRFTVEYHDDRFVSIDSAVDGEPLLQLERDPR